MKMEQAYREYFHDVFLYLCGLTGDPVLAEELAQETFSKALKSLGNFDGRKDIRAWLFTIAKNALASHYRKQKKQVPLELSQETVDTGVHFTEALLDQEQAFLIHRFLHEMKDPYKEVFTLRVFGELPFDKIGLLFGKSAGWARVTYYRAKEMVAAYVKEVYDETDRM
jgi:RNA polymerase sigma-70 factor (ECF subfamily)